MEHPSLDCGPRQLAIGLATYDDYDGIYFTIQAIRMYHLEVLRDANGRSDISAGHHQFTRTIRSCTDYPATEHPLVRIGPSLGSLRTAHPWKFLSAYPCPIPGLLNGLTKIEGTWDHSAAFP